MKKLSGALLLLFISFHLLAQKKETPYVVLISFDGFRHDYVSKFNPPNFKKFIQSGTAAEGMIPSFPSKTFPNHYTIVTGLYPGHHGLVDNQFYDPIQKKGYGMKDKKAVVDSTFYGGTPLWQLVQQHGMKSASFFWVGSEVAVKGKYPDYYYKYDDDYPNDKRVNQVLAWLKLPDKERPQFISLYFSLVDTEGHDRGTNSKELGETIMKADSLLGSLMDGLKKIDLPVNVIIVSDHGMLELKAEEQTYITLSHLFNTKDESVVFANGGTQAHLYTKRADSLYTVLKKKEHHFKVIKRKDFLKEWHYDNDRSGDLLIVADPGYYIQVNPKNFSEHPPKYPVFGAHGFDPYVVKEMQGIFYAMGPNIKSGMKLKPFGNVHVYPLIAKILELKTPKVDGDIKVLEKVYKK